MTHARTREGRSRLVRSWPPDPAPPAPKPAASRPRERPEAEAGGRVERRVEGRPQDRRPEARPRRGHQRLGRRRRGRDRRPASDAHGGRRCRERARPAPPGAAEEAARLLDADGAFLYLLEPRDRVPPVRPLRRHRRPAVRPLDPPARAARSAAGCSARPSPSGGSSSRRTTPPTARSSTRRAPDRFVDEVGLRSLVVAPLVAGTEVFGALGTFSRHPDAFTAPQIALVRSLVRARRVRDGQRPAHRRARPLAAGRRAPGGRRALAARARHPDLGRPRPRGGRPVHDRRGPPAARRRRRPDRHRGSRGAPAQGPVLVGRRADPRDRVAARTRTTRSRSGRPAAPW